MSTHQSQNDYSRWEAAHVLSTDSTGLKKWFNLQLFNLQIFAFTMV